ncbi:MAG: NAD(P)H-dependent oxidoreductase [Acidobacteria bacterium]|nr:MAG: NAD(P)H-dependent oxidoreductase [Acidobacteriota bacterium]
MQRVLAIAGSLRRDSYNKSLLRAGCRVAPQAMQISIYDDLELVPLFNEDLAAADAVHHLRTAVAAADGLLIATPEYNWSIPGVLKNAIDWLSRPLPEEVLIGKPVAIIGVTPGRGATRLAQAALRQVLAATESRVMPAPSLFIQQASAAFDSSGELVDDAYRTQLSNVLAAFSIWLARF